MEITYQLTNAETEMQKHFANADQGFQVKLELIASKWTPEPLPVLGVFAKWREYSEQCRIYDQSPLISEFLEWNNQQHTMIAPVTPSLGGVTGAIMRPIKEEEKQNEIQNRSIISGRCRRRRLVGRLEKMGKKIEREYKFKGQYAQR